MLAISLSSPNQPNYRQRVRILSAKKERQEGRRADKKEDKVGKKTDFKGRAFKVKFLQEL